MFIHRLETRTSFKNVSRETYSVSFSLDLEDENIIRLPERFLKLPMKKSRRCLNIETFIADTV